MKRCHFSALLILLSFCMLLSACMAETPAETLNTFTDERDFSIVESTEPPHTHTFSEATCYAPKICTVCGFSEGDTLEHSWVEATCTTPKTCSLCQKTEGYTAPHTYDEGKCTVCGQRNPSDPENITVWIPTNGGTKYHTHAGCSNMKNPKETTKAAAIEAGFEPCARCH